MILYSQHITYQSEGQRIYPRPQPAVIPKMRNQIWGSEKKIAQLPFNGIFVRPEKEISDLPVLGCISKREDSICLLWRL